MRILESILYSFGFRVGIHNSVQDHHWYFYLVPAIFTVSLVLTYGYYVQRNLIAIRKLTIRLASSILLLFGSAALVNLLIDLIQENTDLIVAFLNIEYLTIPLLLFGLILYYIKREHLFWYGILEILAATFAIALAVNTTQAGLMPKIVGILGGIYISVRGISNVDESVPGKYPEYRELADFIFAKSDLSKDFYRLIIIGLILIFFVIYIIHNKT